MKRRRNAGAFGRAIEKAVPGAAIEEGAGGELIIYTGMVVETDEQDNDTDVVRPMTQEEINNA